MTVLLAQIAPQRSSQYAQLASFLAPAELAASPLGPLLDDTQPVQFGRQPYLKLWLSGPPQPQQLAEAGGLATVSGLFEFFPQVGAEPGPFLRPLELSAGFALPPELVESRRYKGKTNELFTHFLLNLARWHSGYSGTPWGQLRVADPLMGGGTTLLTGLMLGADVAGIEKSSKDAQGTAVFLRNFCREAGIACKVDEQRRRGLDRRWWLAVGQESPQRALLVEGDARQAARHWEGVKRPHLLVADLPYGIQHRGGLAELLAQALPVWADLLLPGGGLALAWESSRFPRARMLDCVAQAGGLEMYDEPPFNRLAHRVDRVIKQRDVLLARKE